MYDPISEKLLASAPGLSGVSSEELPKYITSAYLNLMLVKTSLIEHPENTDETIQELKLISMAQESLAILLPESDLQRSAAYVAATAFKMLQEALAPTRDKQEALTVHAVSPLIAATLLFICADAPAEAIEVAKTMEAPAEQRYVSLYNMIVSLPASLSGLAAEDDSPLDMYSNDPNQIIADIGYKRCLMVTRELVDYLIGETDHYPSAEKYYEISNDMRFPIEVGSSNSDEDKEIVIVGPWKLARLLSLAAKSMIRSATISVEAPEGVEKSRWREALKPIARHRPMLWSNHVDAINRGFLKRNVSSVVTFPTGAGKSTLSELKILGCMLAGRNVVYLVPTHALADQVSETMDRRFFNAKITSSENMMDFALDEDSNIFVVTPESCLAQLGRDSEVFGQVGLVVFDEAHLLHSDDGSVSKRSIDATLSLIKMLEAFPDTDVMLASAMIANGREIADWLTEITGKTVLNLNHAWKPTQQVSGALVYSEREVSSLQAMLRSMLLAQEGSSIPASVKRLMYAHPHALFSLNPRWGPFSLGNYKLLKLLDEPLLLGVSKNDAGTNWWPTANANRVSSKIAARAGASGIKTLVFAPTIPFANSICKFNEFADFEPVSLNENELRLLDSCRRTLGSDDALYINQAEGIVLSGAIPHHSLLLREERQLHESLYRRDDGVSVLVATSTVAQGVNFPSEFVVVAGDKRFDPDRAQRSALRAHELLNAAGRGGRAGQRSAAMFLIVPGDVVTFDDGQVSPNWGRLQSVFAHGDQCLYVNDPLVQLADRVVSEDEDRLCDYMVRRIHEFGESADAGRIIRLSLSAYKKRQAGHVSELESSIQRLSEDDSLDGLDPWIVDCVIATGISPDVFEYLSSRLGEFSLSGLEIESVFDVLFDIFSDSEAPLGDILEILRMESVVQGEDSDNDDMDVQSALTEHDRQLTKLWMQGKSLLDMQKYAMDNALTRSSNMSAGDNIHLVFARKFVLNRIPHLAYLFSLPAMLGKSKLENVSAEIEVDTLRLEHVPICMERGVNSSAKLEVMLSSRGISREDAHERFD